MTWLHVDKLMDKETRIKMQMALAKQFPKGYMHSGSMIYDQPGVRTVLKNCGIRFDARD